MVKQSMIIKKTQNVHNYTLKGFDLLKCVRSAHIKGCFKVNFIKLWTVNLLKERKKFMASSLFYRIYQLESLEPPAI